MKKISPLFLIMGKSGSGKDYLVDKFCQSFNICDFTKVLSYTTRSRRFPEENTHTFISKSDYNKLKNVIASTYFNGEFYCATKEMIENANFYIIDTSGAEEFYSKYGHNFYGRTVIYIYLDVNVFIRFVRMCKRNGIKKSIERIKNDKKAFMGIKNKSYIIKLKNPKKNFESYIMKSYFKEN